MCQYEPDKRPTLQTVVDELTARLDEIREEEEARRVAADSIDDEKRPAKDAMVRQFDKYHVSLSRYEPVVKGGARR